MKKLLITLGLMGCAAFSQAAMHTHNAENSLDWAGEYQGKINAKNKVNLILSHNKHYELQDRSPKKPTYLSKGKFTFDVKNPSMIHLVNERKYKKLFVGENFISLHKSSKYKVPKVSEITYFDIAPEKKTCSHGAGKGECWQVKEFTKNAKGKKHYINQDWEYFYSNIEGYTPSTTQVDEVKVKKTYLKNVPADASSIRYVVQP